MLSIFNFSQESRTGLIAFGANLGDSEQTYLAAVDRIRQIDGVDVRQASRALRTKAVKGRTAGDTDSPDYLNAVIRIDTTLQPEALHAQTIEIEQEFGRTRNQRWGDRTIDLDLLLLQGIVVNSSSLCLPHPRMSFRRFVLEPAAEIAGNVVHPTSGCTINQLLDRINAPTKTLGVAFSKNLEHALMAQQLVERLSALHGDWQFENIFSEKLFLEKQSRLTILVVFGGGCADDNSQGIDFHRQTLQFAGPRLTLPLGSSFAVALAEVHAAIETIGPPHHPLALNDPIDL